MACSRIRNRSIQFALGLDKQHNISTGYPAPLLAQYEATLKQLVTAIKQLLQYAGEGEWNVFAVS